MSHRLFNHVSLNSAILIGCFCLLHRPVAIAALTPVISAPQGVTGASILISVTFQTDKTPTHVSGFSVNDISVTNGTVSDFSGSGHTYTFHVTPTTKPVDINVAIAANAATSKFAILDTSATVPFHSWSKKMQIGFPATCPAVMVPGSGGQDCGAIGAITTLEHLIACVDCVTEVNVVCANLAAVPGVATYPAECHP